MAVGDGLGMGEGVPVGDGVAVPDGVLVGEGVTVGFGVGKGVASGLDGGGVGGGGGGFETNVSFAISVRCDRSSINWSEPIRTLVPLPKITRFVSTRW